MGLFRVRRDLRGEVGGSVGRSGLRRGIEEMEIVGS